MGDIIQTLPFLDSLKESFPQAKISFLTSSLGVELLKLKGGVDDFFKWDCIWFDPKRKPVVSLGEVVRWIKMKNFDGVFELRGDVRLIGLLKYARAKNIVGYGSTGGGFLLDINVPWEKDIPAIDKNLKLLAAIGGKTKTDVPHLKFSSQDNSSSNSNDKFRLVIHPDAGTAAKKWPVDYFVELIKKLLINDLVQIDLIGLDKELGQVIEKRVGGSLQNYMGKTTFLELCELLIRSDGLLSNDSGPAHLMAALGKPVWVLWSGTAPSQVWAPRGSFVHLFEQAVPCAPCSHSICPVGGHPCLTNISVDSVFNVLTSEIRKLKSFSKVK